MCFNDDHHFRLHRNATDAYQAFSITFYFNANEEKDLRKLGKF